MLLGDLQKAQDIKLKLEALIAQLGDTPQCIAANLAKNGVKGRRQNPNYCPIAQEIRRVLSPIFGDEPLEVSVGKVTHSIAQHNPEDVTDYRQQQHKLSTAAQNFIVYFDMGHFLELREDYVPLIEKESANAY